jgi:hypothetical protein
MSHVQIPPLKRWAIIECPSGIGTYLVCGFPNPSDIGLEGPRSARRDRLQPAEYWCLMPSSLLAIIAASMSGTLNQFSRTDAASGAAGAEKAGSYQPAWGYNL